MVSLGAPPLWFLTIHRYRSSSDHILYVVPGLLHLGSPEPIPSQLLSFVFNTFIVVLILVRSVIRDVIITATPVNMSIGEDDGGEQQQHQEEEEKQLPPPSQPSNDTDRDDVVSVEKKDMKESLVGDGGPPAEGRTAVRHFSTTLLSNLNRRCGVYLCKSCVLRSFSGRISVLTDST